MKTVLRVLCGILDTMLVMIPSQLFLIFLYQATLMQANVLFLLLLIVYNVLFIESMNGQTPGKVIGRLVVRKEEDILLPPSTFSLFKREVVKALYFLPMLGWVLGLASLIGLAFGKKTLHDRAGKTAVVSVWQCLIAQKEKESKAI